MLKCLENFQKMTCFYKSFYPFISKNLHFHFKPSQNVPPILQLKDPLSGLQQFLTIESPLKMMKNTFYSMLKGLFVLEILKFLSSLFGHVDKGIHEKAMINIKIYGVADWTINNKNTHITRYLKN